MSTTPRSPRQQGTPTSQTPNGESVNPRIERIVAGYQKEILKNLENEYHTRTSFSDKLADRIASFGGSWSFIVGMAFVLVLWMLWNSSGLTPFHFDPEPYILLNLILSFLAAFQAPIIMMSQNRQASRDKQEAGIDFALNYRAERNTEDMQGHLHRIEKDLAEIKRLLQAGQKEVRQEQNPGPADLKGFPEPGL